MEPAVEPAVETLHVAVLPRSARFDVRCPHFDEIEKRTYAMADKFRAVVAANKLWHATSHKQISQQEHQINERTRQQNIRIGCLRQGSKWESQWKR